MPVRFIMFGIASTTAFGTSTENTFNADHILIGVKSVVRVGLGVDP